MRAGWLGLVPVSYRLGAVRILQRWLALWARMFTCWPPKLSKVAVTSGTSVGFTLGSDGTLPAPLVGECSDVKVEGLVERFAEVIAAYRQAIWTRPLQREDLGDWGVPLLPPPCIPRSSFPRRGGPARRSWEGTGGRRVYVCPPAHLAPSLFSAMADFCSG